MGNVNCGPLAVLLWLLLKVRGIRIDKQTVLQFFECINGLAPWFLPTGSLTLPSWDKLGCDIQFAGEQGMGVNPMVRPIWEMVRACLKAKSMVGTAQGLKKARHAFERACSESSRGASEAGSLDHSSDSEGEGPLTGPKGEDSGKTCSHHDTGQETNKPSRTLCKGLMESLEEELQRVENDIQEVHTPGGTRPTPSAPPWEPPQGMSAPGGWGLPPPFPATLPSSGRRSFHGRLWDILRRGLTSYDIPGFYPVFQDQAGTPYYQALDMKVVKGLKEAVSTYGPNAPFTQALLDNIGTTPLTPSDWAQLAKACLSPGQFMDWKAWNDEYCGEQAEKNARERNARWNKDMLLGQGAHAQDQIRHPQAVYDQITKCAIAAWKQLAKPGEHTACLTKIVQGMTEPFSDFVARMLDAAGKVFPDLSLVALVGASINVALGSHPPATQQQMQKSKKCFECGQPGHVRRFCPNKEGKGTASQQYGTSDVGQVGLCQRCRKGHHAAKDCRSVFDKEGNSLTGRKDSQPKNGQRGPSYKAGLLSPSSPFPGVNSQSGLPQGQQEWTSVPPPDSY
ncbi:endogenous retrovirus group K member 5 Gag polyprotein-like [Cavia porcellus]|uniref:endogenous retrovirus group K member 5 Gag polyprotein-like n=1 Tax=Cavia porcellus TaxID=10141 RepID=UPI002FE12BE7